MIIRKNGETSKQYIKRLEAYIQNIEENNRSLRVHVNTLATETDIMNPRTNRTYKQEAQELFITVALTENALRDDNKDWAQAMTQGQLDMLGFSQVEIYQDECLKDGAYTSAKKS